MKNLKPDTEYDNMFEAGSCRAKADWYIGMTLSRLYTIINGSDRCLHRVGRVKTPILNIIVKRDAQISKFKRVPFYKLQLDNGAECETEYESKEAAQNIVDKCMNGCATCIEAEVTERTENRPLLHSLTTLQQEANDKLGYTADETLKAAQSLYEKKLITYPRTESNYLSDDMIPIITKITEYLKGTIYQERATQLLNSGLNIDNRIIDNNKITDHHALIPTENIKSINSVTLSEQEKNVADLIINRFLLILEKPYRYLTGQYTFDAEYEKFVLKARVSVELGWRKYVPDEKAITSLPEYKVNQTFTITGVNIKECEKQPPKHYTDSTLLSCMVNIDNIIDDKDLKEYVIGKGLGTTATRSKIIEELISAGYIERKNKQLIATGFGTEFIESIPESVKSVERTAEWEKILVEIEKGSAKENMLLDDIKKFVNNVVASEKNANHTPMKNTNITPYTKEIIGKCPRCGKNIYEGKSNYYCESGKDGCGFVLWKQSKFISDTITLEKASKLLSNEAVKLKAIGKDGKPYISEYKLVDTGTYINLERQQIIVGKCPRCGKNIYEGKSNYYCESGKDGCGFVLWKQNKIPELTITLKQAEKLIKGENISVKSKYLNGTTVSTNYKIDDTGKYINIVKA